MVSVILFHEQNLDANETVRRTTKYSEVAARDENPEYDAWLNATVDATWS